MIRPIALDPNRLVWRGGKKRSYSKNGATLKLPLPHTIRLKHVVLHEHERLLLSFTPERDCHLVDKNSLCQSCRTFSEICIYRYPWAVGYLAGASGMLFLMDA